MLIYQLQEKISEVITKVMKKQEWKRRIRRRVEIELVITNIKPDSFEFESAREINEDVVRTYEIFGNYSENQAGFKFRFVIEKDEKPVVIAYTIYINEDNNVICVPDDYENSLNGINPERLEFTV